MLNMVNLPSDVHIECGVVRNEMEIKSKEQMGQSWNAAVCEKK